MGDNQGVFPGSSCFISLPSSIVNPSPLSLSFEGLREKTVDKTKEPGPFSGERLWLGRGLGLNLHYSHLRELMLV